MGFIHDNYRSFLLIISQYCKLSKVKEPSDKFNQ
jgi:hypothetical protein